MGKIGIYNKIQLYYGKLFSGGEWKVAYRSLSDQNAKYEIIEAPEGTWIADPLLYEANGEHYLFVELFDKKKDRAGIGYYHFINGKPVFQKKIIEQPFHLSYPCVFYWNGEHYMIPESAAANTVDLYRAVHFPEEWTWDSNLIRGEKYVDTTIVQVDGKLYALGYTKADNGWKLTYFNLDMQKRSFHKIHDELFLENKGRPAGHVLQEEMIRPAQDCSRLYGESIIWYKVIAMNEYVFREQPIKMMTVADLAIEGKADRVHTYSRDTMFEVVDLRYGRFDLLHGIKTLRRSMSNRNN